MGTTNKIGFWLQDQFPMKARTKQQATSVNLQEGKHCMQEKHVQTISPYSQLFLVSKKVGRQRPVKFKTIQPISKNTAFQDGRYLYIERPAKTRRWMAKIDLKDAYLMITVERVDRNSSASKGNQGKA